MTNQAVIVLRRPPGSFFGAWRSFVVRIDGTGYRQITDDEFRNRGPSWSADGSLIGFYSNRSGRYQVWTLRPDGSGLELFTKIDKGSLWYPEWAPDGSRVAVAGSEATRLIDPRKALTDRVVLELPRLPDGSIFHAVSWSGDGKVIGGMGLKPDGFSGGVWLYRVDTQRFERATDRGRIPHMLADGTKLVYYDQGGVLRFLNTTTGQTVELLSTGWSGQTNNRQFRITRDNRQIVFLRAETESDIWLMTPE